MSAIQPAPDPSAQPIITSAPPVSVVPTMTLRRFLEETATAIRHGVPAKLWLEATIIGVKAGPYGHQIELVDTDAKSSPHPPQMRAFLATADRRAISAAFGLDVDPVGLIGLTATLLIVPGFHPKFHLQGRVIGLSQALQQSLLAAAVEQIRIRLKRDGLYDRQRRLRPVRDITRLAVIHPAGAAGWADISGPLAAWQAAGILEVVSIPASFEGPRAPAELLAALATATQPIDGDIADLIVIVRGGGDRAGLMVLDDERVARALCNCPVPVMTGLGHAINISLLDDVAHQPFDTPSKVLEHLRTIIVAPARRALADMASIEAGRIACLTDAERSLALVQHRAFGDAERKLNSVATSLASMWAGVRADGAALSERCGRLRDAAERLVIAVLDRAPLRLDAADQAAGRIMTDLGDRVRLRLEQTDSGDRPLGIIVARAQALLDTRRADLDHRIEVPVLAALRRLSVAETDLDRLRQLIDMLGAEATLARGYAIVTSRDGQLISNREVARLAVDLAIQFVDGRVAARVDPSLATMEDAA